MMLSSTVPAFPVYFSICNLKWFQSAASKKFIVINLKISKEIKLESKKLFRQQHQQAYLLNGTYCSSIVSMKKKYQCKMIFEYYTQVLVGKKAVLLKKTLRVEIFQFGFDKTSV